MATTAGDIGTWFQGSVSKLFQQLGLIQWWDTSRVTQFFGQNGERGTDFGLGQFGANVGSLTAGKVVYIGNGGYPGSSIGQIVQVLMPNGGLVHYQHLMTSNVTVGQQVLPGTVLGTGGGCPVGKYPNPLSSSQGCTSYDQYSSGQHIEVRYSPSYSPSGGVWSQAWTNPLGIFQGLGGQSVSQSLSGLTNIGTSTGGMPPTGGGDNCALWDVGCHITSAWNSMITSSWFEQGAFVVVGLLLALVALVVIAVPELNKVRKEVI